MSTTHRNSPWSGIKAENVHSIQTSDGPSERDQSGRRHSKRKHKRKRSHSNSSSSRSRYRRSKRSHSSSDTSQSSSGSTERKRRSRRHRKSKKRRSCSTDSNDRYSSEEWQIRKRKGRSRSSSNGPTSHGRRTPVDEVVNGTERLDSRLQPQTTSFEAKPVVYPPGIRLVVLASGHTNPGTVFMLNSEETSIGWGCIGSNTTFCPSVNFPDDPDVSTIHCQVVYNAAEERYALLDRESSSGTFVNGRAISKESPTEVKHGDVFRIGSSRLLIHIHRGTDVCEQCDTVTARSSLGFDDTNEGEKEEEESKDEIRQMLTSIPEKKLDEVLLQLASGSVGRDAVRRATMSDLKDKYGLKVPTLTLKGKIPDVYNDRAAMRRMKKAHLKETANTKKTLSGAKNRNHSSAKTPLVARPLELTPGSNLPMGMENKGAKLLSKMGWTPGQGLGKDKSGIVEPIAVHLRVNKNAGFGSKDNLIKPQSTPRQQETARIMAVTRQRYAALE